MGTKKEDSQKNIDQLKKMLKKLGWTQRQFADHYFENIIDISGTCLDEEANTFYEKFKKNLQRKTTSIETIQGYIEYLEKIDDFRKVGGIRTQCISDDLLNSEMLKELRDISKCVTDIVRKNETKGV